jgi:hypothetical protein
MQKIAKLNFVYDIRVVRIIFVSYFGYSRKNQEKYAFARTSESCLSIISYKIFCTSIILFYQKNNRHFCIITK